MDAYLIAVSMVLVGVCLGCTVTIFRLISDVRLWRDEERTMRDLWRAEKDLRQRIQGRLNDVLKEQERNGVYR